MGARLKTINADEAAYEGFRQLAKEHKLTSPELVAAMVQYFKVTKADPTQPTGPDLTTLLAKLGAKIDGLDKRTIGFIREQEKQYLKPILAQVDALQVLSGPAPSAPAGLSDAQVTEVGNWFMRYVRRKVQPAQLSQDFLNTTLPKPPAQGQVDTSLDPLRQQLMGVLVWALRPELLVPQAPAPAVTPPTQPA